MLIYDIWAHSCISWEIHGLGAVMALKPSISTISSFTKFGKESWFVHWMEESKDFLYIFKQEELCLFDERAIEIHFALY